MGKRSHRCFKCRDFSQGLLATGTRVPTRSKPSHSMTHVMFSYNWDHQELVLEVFRVLKSKGVDIWVDVQGSSVLGKMAGSTDEMMIKATPPRSAFVKRRLVIHTRFVTGRESFEPRGRVCHQEISGIRQLQPRGNARRNVCLSILCKCPYFCSCVEPMMA